MVSGTNRPTRPLLSFKPAYHARVPIILHHSASEQASQSGLKVANSGARRVFGAHPQAP